VLDSILSSFHFDGDDDVLEVPDHPSVRVSSVTKAWTLSFWIKLEAPFNGSGPTQTIASKFLNNGTNHSIQLTGTTGPHIFSGGTTMWSTASCNGGGSNCDSDIEDFPGSLTGTLEEGCCMYLASAKNLWNAKQWYHIAITYQTLGGVSELVQLYIDGVQDPGHTQGIMQRVDWSFDDDRGRALQASGALWSFGEGLMETSGSVVQGIFNGHFSYIQFMKPVITEIEALPLHTQHSMALLSMLT
jgi:hypothetical protein